MPAFCGVFMCGNRSDRDNKSFFRLPAVLHKGGTFRKHLSIQRRGKWMLAIRRSDLNDEKKKWLRVCEDHFIAGKPADLLDVHNPDWVPSQRMGYHKNVSRTPSLISCESDDYNYKGNFYDSDTTTSEEVKVIPMQSVACQTDLTLQDIRNMERAYTDTIRELAEIREKVNKLSVSENTFKDDDEKTMYYTGVPNFELLMKIYNLVENDLPQNPGNLLTKFQHFALTLMRLRLNLDLNDLSHRFLVSKNTVLKAFANCIYVMYKKFKNYLVWPNRDALIVKEPDSIIESDCDRVTVIINCFEILTHKSLKSIGESGTFKPQNKIKFLIAISPQGGITFISSSWAGYTADEHIVQKCGILDLLLPGDIVICDKGIDIHNDDSEEESIIDSKPDSRKCAEKVVHQLKQYKFLHRTMPTSFVTSNKPEVPSLVEQVVKVCCCLINISYNMVSLE